MFLLLNPTAVFTDTVHMSPPLTGHLGFAGESRFLSRNRQCTASPSPARHGRSHHLLAEGPKDYRQLRRISPHSQVFCEISLEKRPDLWQDDEDTEKKNIERIAFLASFPQTEYRAQLDPKKSTTRKNEVLAKALKEKGNKSYASGDNIEAMNHYNQALRFATVDQQVFLLVS